MSVELFRRARRAEARAERAEDRRRLRLEFFRQALTQGFDSLKVRHAEGASGQESVRTHARLMDDVIFSLTRLVAADAGRARLDPTPLVVTALGGYGRGELHPLSDIDLMMVYEGELSPYVQRMMQELLYSLWDLGLQVGHSLRSLDDCVAMARTDFPSRTSMQEARFLAGDRRLFGRFRKVLRENVYRRDFAQFLETTLTERDQRYRRYGASPYIGEPNVKESAGGLRDVHTAMWLGAAKFGARTLRELSDKGLITPREQAATDAALTFLWRVRNELHFFSGHKNDVLSRDLQPRIAPADRTLPGDFVAPRLGRAAPAAAGAGRRARVLRRPAPPSRSRLGAAARRPGPAHEGVLAPASPRLRAVARSRAGARGLALPRGRRLPALGARARSVPGHLPDVGARRADVPGDARARAARTVPAGVRRADVPGSVRRLPQVLGRSALAARRRAPRGAGARAVRRVGRRRAGIERGGETRAPHARHAAARRRQGPRAWPRREGHSADPRADHADRPSTRRRRAGRVPGGAPPHDVAHRPAARHRRPQDHRGLRADRQRSAATQDALPAHLGGHAGGRARRPHPMAGHDPARALQAYACPAHRWSQRASEPDPARRAASPGRRRRAAGASGQGASGDDVRPLPGNDGRATDGRAPPDAPGARDHLGRDRAVPSSRTGLVRSRRGHPRPARALLADRGHARLAGCEYHLRPDPHARRRDRHRHLPGQRSSRRRRRVAGALGARPRRPPDGADGRGAGCDLARETPGLRPRRRRRRGPGEDHARQSPLR